MRFALIGRHAGSPSGGLWQGTGHGAGAWKNAHGPGRYGRHGRDLPQYPQLGLGMPGQAYVGEQYAIDLIQSEGDKDRAKYAAIGESDRFTLKFIKPSN